MITQFNNLNFNIIIVAYVILIFAIIFLSLFLSKLCVILEKRTKLSEATIGVILLGITTSFPELITCLSSIFIKPNNGFIALGDIIGSNLFDLFVLACCLLWLFIRKQNKKIDKSNFINLICMLSNTIFCFLACVLHNHFTYVNNFNFFTICFLAIFLINTYFLMKNNKNSSKSIQNFYPNKQIKITFFNNCSLWIVILSTILISILLIGCSYFLTIFAVKINDFLHLDNTFGGAILLGIITSLPEVITCISLTKYNCYNMLIGNIVGSINFNFTILFFTNVLLSIIYNNEMFIFFDNQENKNISWQIIFLTIQSFFAFLYASINIKKGITKYKKLLLNSSKCISLTLVSSCYLAFILIGCLFN